MAGVQLGRLEGFFHVARHRGYARAARAFPYPITQPGVHHQVKKLEQELGATLFERIGKDELRLTPAGERLYAFCAPFLEQLPSVVDAIQSESFGGVLKLDASGLVLRQLLPSWLRALRAARTDVGVDVEEIQAPDFDRLRTGVAHVIIDYCERVPAGCLPIIRMRGDASSTSARCASCRS
jgi:DNA-binding transcriptional LysR family regulator